VWCESDELESMMVEWSTARKGESKNNKKDEYIEALYILIHIDHNGDCHTHWYAAVSNYYFFNPTL